MSHSFMGMPRLQTFQEFGGQVYTHPYVSQPSYSSSSYYDQSSDLTLDIWYPTFIQSLYILARTLNIEKTDKTPLAMKTFINNLFKLVPNATYRSYLNDFLMMKPYVVSAIKSTEPNIVNIKPSFDRDVQDMQSIKRFHERSFNNTDGQEMLFWVYLLDLFMISIMNANQTQTNNPFATVQRIKPPTLNEIRQKFHPQQTITKAMWGNAFWFLIHLTALYAPQPIQVSFDYYKQMLNALRFILPCVKCRAHLTNNLHYIDFDTCGKTNEDLFKCSWKLHNIVNKSENKPLMSLQEAFSRYTF